MRQRTTSNQEPQNAFMEMKIIEQVAMQLPCRSEWLTILNCTNPGHYGIIECDALIDKANVCVNIPERTFQITNVPFEFTLKLGSSSDDDGYSARYNRLANGKGRFRFDEYLEKIIIEELIISVDLDLFE